MTRQLLGLPPPPPPTHLHPEHAKKGPRVRAALSTLVASLSVETPPAAAAEAEAEATADTSDDQPKSAANGFHPIAEAASSTPMVANGIESAEDPVAAAPAPAPAKIPLGPVRSVPKAGGIRWAGGIWRWYCWSSSSTVRLKTTEEPMPYDANPVRYCTTL